MEQFIEWAPTAILIVGGMSIVCTIVHVIQSTLRPPDCCKHGSGNFAIGIPQIHPNDIFRYIRLETQPSEIDGWHKTPYPVYNV
ncbi:unnamed protein product [Caenorhabditis bovis]|uniref:Uncharacterized protein n=1 Tax=Caenorhabditis bovis TaxID=2654633 RepID=A0A8S1F5H7_9PELO|nr:unnamed protein product [Caenorhabditis bovis]